MRQQLVAILLEHFVVIAIALLLLRIQMLPHMLPQSLVLLIAMRQVTLQRLQEQHTPMLLHSHHQRQQQHIAMPPHMLQVLLLLLIAMLSAILQQTVQIVL